LKRRLILKVKIRKGGSVKQVPLVFTGESGFYADKAAKVILIDPQKNETVPCRAIYNRENLRPPQLNAKQVDERTNRLISVGAGASIDSLIEALGAADSSMGSGFYYEVFYLKDALAVINRILRKITISLPGLEHISFEEWIRRQKEGKNSTPVSP